MMKRTLAMLLALALLAALAGCAVAEEQQEEKQEEKQEAQTQSFRTEFYSVSVPVDWVIDTGNLESDAGYYELGILYSEDDPGIMVEASMSYNQADAELILWDVSAEEMQVYINGMLDLMKDDAPEYVDTIKAGSIPFILIRARDADGPYYYAQTVTNGYSMMFFAYAVGSGDDYSAELTEEQLGQFIAMLESFAPVL